MATLAREIGRGTAFGLVAESLALPAGLILAAVLSRALGPEAYGRYGLAVAIVLAAEWLLIAAVARATTQILGDPGTRAALEPFAMRHHLYLGIGVAAMVFLLADPIALLLHSRELAADLRWLAVDIPLFSICQLQRVLLTIRPDYVRRSVVIATRWISRVAWTCILLEWGVRGAILAWPLSSACELLAVRQLPMTGIFRAWAVPTGVWGRSWPQVLFATGQRICERGDLLALQAFQTETAIGMYVAAQNIAIVPGLLGSALAPILMAAMTRERALGREPASRSAALLSFKATLYMLPLAPVFAYCGEDLVGLAFGREYRAAAEVAGLLVAAYIGLSVLTVAGSVLTSRGRERISAAVSLPVAFAYVVVLIVVVPRFGMSGAAVVTMSTGLLAGAGGMAMVYREWGEPFPTTMVLRALGAICVTAALGQVPWVAVLWWPIRAAVLTATAAGALLAFGEWRMVNEAYRRRA
jgi:O-antigen/teichoic acid export membrane protein